MAASRDFQGRRQRHEGRRCAAAPGGDAADKARRRAAAAFFAGERGDYLYWLAICRALDRRLVEAGRG